MDWNLRPGGATVYRAAQGFAALIIPLFLFADPIPPDAPVLFPLALTLTAIFLLALVVRILGGNYAGAISLLLLSYPGFVSSSFDQALALFCLSGLMALLVIRNYAHRSDNVALCLALAVPVALGAHMRLSLLPLSAAVAFAYLLLRYVPPDSIRPYQTLLNSLRTNSSGATWELLIITVAALLSLFPLLLSDTTRIQSNVNSAPGDPTGYLVAVARLLFQFLCAGEDLETLPALLTPLLLITSCVTLWWLFVSVQSGSGLPFVLTGIPVAYLLCGALGLRAGRSYAHPVNPILVANLIAFLGLWLRGRANKRVVDSTTN